MVTREAESTWLELLKEVADVIRDIDGSHFSLPWQEKMFCFWEVFVPRLSRVKPEQYKGCLLGLALGDALGAPHEGGLLEQLTWRLIGRTADGFMRWTDDTQMSIDLAESLIEHRGLDLDDVAQRFARNYCWSRGYGPGAAKVLRRIARGAAWEDASRSVYPSGSYGNGGAMRAPVIALFAARQAPEVVSRLSRDSARVTHAHPLGQEGASMIAAATLAALEEAPPVDILCGARRAVSDPALVARIERASAALTSQEWLDSGQIRRELGNGMTALESCVTAIYLAGRGLEDPFETLVRSCVEVRGDVDTICAMAGAIWGAWNGVARLPAALLLRLEARSRIEATAEGLWAASQS